MENLEFPEIFFVEKIREFVKKFSHIVNSRQAKWIICLKYIKNVIKIDHTGKFYWW